MIPGWIGKVAEIVDCLIQSRGDLWAFIQCMVGWDPGGVDDDIRPG
ncbi:MAG: hypothetical protein OXQ94_12195 [Gemmatimonadota bacterium]|nr:hypothetical protein [Gemmatimonadota bacterium]MDE2872431.1 hypothetical protein [Gemmatimonadota bacterium]